jgi:hypothetical protein
MPRFLNTPDSEILAASLKLRDAQEMVARQHGFDSWQALRTGLADTSRKIKKVKASPSKATIINTEPQLFVLVLGPYHSLRSKGNHCFAGRPIQ